MPGGYPARCGDLPQAESSLSFHREDVADAELRVAYDLGVQIDEGELQSAGERGTQRRLSCTRKPDEDEKVPALRS